MAAPDQLWAHSAPGSRANRSRNTGAPLPAVRRTPTCAPDTDRLRKNGWGGETTRSESWPLQAVRVLLTIRWVNDNGLRGRGCGGVLFAVNPNRPVRSIIVWFINRMSVAIQRGQHLGRSGPQPIVVRLVDRTATANERQQSRQLRLLRPRRQPSELGKGLAEALGRLHSTPPRRTCIGEHLSFLKE